MPVVNVGLELALTQLGHTRYRTETAILRVSVHPVSFAEIRSRIRTAVGILESGGVPCPGPCNKSYHVGEQVGFREIVLDAGRTIEHHRDSQPTASLAQRSLVRDVHAELATCDRQPLPLYSLRLHVLL